MIGTLISILFALIILGVLWWAVQQLLGLIPLAEPFATIVRVVMVVILVLIVLWIIAQLLGMAGIHVGGFRLSGLLGVPGRAVAALSAAAAEHMPRLPVG